MAGTLVLAALITPVAVSTGTAHAAGGTSPPSGKSNTRAHLYHRFTNAHPGSGSDSEMDIDTPQTRKRGRSLSPDPAARNRRTRAGSPTDDTAGTRPGDLNPGIETFTSLQKLQQALNSRNSQFKVDPYRTRIDGDWAGDPVAFLQRAIQGEEAKQEARRAKRSGYRGDTPFHGAWVPFEGSQSVDGSAWYEFTWQGTVGYVHGDRTNPSSTVRLDVDPDGLVTRLRPVGELVHRPGPSTKRGLSDGEGRAPKRDRPDDDMDLN
jgi:hypothetical protein